MASMLPRCSCDHAAALQDCDAGPNRALEDPYPSSFLCRKKIFSVRPVSAHRCPRHACHPCQAPQALRQGSSGGIPSVGPAAAARSAVAHGVQPRRVLVRGALGVDAHQHARVRRAKPRRKDTSRVEEAGSIRTYGSVACCSPFVRQCSFRGLGWRPVGGPHCSTKQRTYFRRKLIVAACTRSPCRSTYRRFFVVAAGASKDRRRVFFYLTRQDYRKVTKNDNHVANNASRYLAARLPSTFTQLRRPPSSLRNAERVGVVGSRQGCVGTAGGCLRASRKESGASGGLVWVRMLKRERLGLARRVDDR